MIEEPTDLRERLLRERTRVCDRLRSLPLSSRLTANADLARAAAEHLAQIAARLRGEPMRALPLLADTAAADQVAVTAYDVLRESAPWEDEALADAVAVLVDLRRAMV